MSWEEPIAFASLLISIAAFVIYVIYSRPKAQLAKIGVKEKQADLLARHYDELLKWFFAQIGVLTGPGSLDENSPLEGVDEYSKKLREISSKDYFRPHWENGLKHVMVDDTRVYELMNSLAVKFDQLAKETDNLLTLIKGKIKSTIEDPGMSSVSFPISPGKIYTVNLIDLLTRDWEHSLRICSKESDADLNCLASYLPPETFIEDNTGRVIRYSNVFAQTSPQYSSKDLFDLVWSVEKDHVVLKKIVAIRNLRYDLKKDLTEIHNYATGVIRKIELKSYGSIAECCHKS